MNKAEFLEQLREELADLPVEERGTALQYFSMYFEDAGSEREQDVIRELGTPRQVAADVRSADGGLKLGQDAEAPQKAEPEPLNKKQAPQSEEKAPVADGQASAATRKMMQEEAPAAPQPPSYYNRVTPQDAPAPVLAEEQRPLPATVVLPREARNVSGPLGWLETLVLGFLRILVAILLFCCLITVASLLLVPFLTGLGFLIGAVITIIFSVPLFFVSVGHALVLVGSGFLLVVIGLLLIWLGTWLMKKCLPPVWKGIGSVFGAKQA